MGKTASIMQQTTVSSSDSSKAGVLPSNTITKLNT